LLWAAGEGHAPDKAAAASCLWLQLLIQTYKLLRASFDHLSAVEALLSLAHLLVD
jgi:hypothetical protein